MNSNVRTFWAEIVFLIGILAIGFTMFWAIMDAARSRQPVVSKPVLSQEQLIPSRDCDEDEWVECMMGDDP